MWVLNLAHALITADGNRHVGLAVSVKHKLYEFINIFSVNSSGQHRQYS